MVHRSRAIQCSCLKSNTYVCVGGGGYLLSNRTLLKVAINFLAMIMVFGITYNLKLRNVLNTCYRFHFLCTCSLNLNCMVASFLWAAPSIHF